MPAFEFRPLQAAAFSSLHPSGPHSDLWRYKGYLGLLGPGQGLGLVVHDSP